MSESRVKGRGAVGDSAVRIDGVPKATGSFTYASDLRLDGMLWGATVRSPLPHAGVRGVDAARAIAIPGVAAAAVVAALRNATGRELNRAPVTLDELTGLRGPSQTSGPPPPPDVPGQAAVPSYHAMASGQQNLM